MEELVERSVGEMVSPEGAENHAPDGHRLARAIKYRSLPSNYEEAPTRVAVRAPLRERTLNADESLSPASGYRSIPAKLEASPFVESNIHNLRVELTASQKEEERLRED